VSRVLKYGGRVRTGSEPGQAETPAHHAPRKTAMGVGAVDHTRFGEVDVRQGRTRGQKQAFVLYWGATQKQAMLFVLSKHPTPKLSGPICKAVFGNVKVLKQCND
jgi:hypothetical protein